MSRLSPVLVLAVSVAWLSLVPRQVPASLKFTGNAADIATFRGMLEQCGCKQLGLLGDGTVVVVQKLPVEDCPTATESMSGLLNKVIQGHQEVTMDIGRKQANTMVDAFGGDGAGAVDVTDLEQLPETAPATAPEASNRCQNIAHFLGEYWRAATNGIPAGGADFRDSHAAGIAAENTYRQQRGQTTQLTGSPGTATELHMQYSNGTTEIWNLVGGGTNIGSIKDPAIPYRPARAERTAVARPVLPAGPGTLIFTGQVLAVGASPLKYSGRAEARQTVTYQILQVISGTAPGAEIDIHHLIVLGSTDVDPSGPSLDPALFALGNVLRVEAEPCAGSGCYVAITEVVPVTAAPGADALRLVLLAALLIGSSVHRLAPSSHRRVFPAR